MDVIIQSLGFTASNDLQSLIKEKLDSLKGDKLIRANVTLYKGPSGEPDSDYCEVRLEVPGNDHFVKRHSQHFETSVRECVEVLAQSLHKAKDQEKYRQADAVAIQDAIMQAEDDADEDVELEDVVK